MECIIKYRTFVCVPQTVRSRGARSDRMQAPYLGILFEHGLNEATKAAAVAGGHWRVLSTQDFDH